MSQHPPLRHMLSLACSYHSLIAHHTIRHTKPRMLTTVHCSPFVYSPNDLPTARLQYLFNERLLQNAAGIIHDKVWPSCWHATLLA